MTDAKKTAIIKAVITFVLIVLIAAVESSLFPYMRIMGVVPSVLIFTVTAVAVFEGPAGGLACGTVAGLFADGIGGLGFCYYTVFMAFTGAFVGTASPGLFRKRIPTAIGWGSLFWFLCEFIRFFFSLYLFGKAGFSSVISIILPGLFYSLLISPLAVLPISRMYRKLKKEPGLFR